MAVPAEAFDVVMRTAPSNVLVKWQAIQDEIGFFPPNALRDLIAQLSRTLRDTDHEITSEVLDLVDDWYRQALATRANRLDPVSPVLTKDDWDRLPTVL